MCVKTESPDFQTTAFCNAVVQETHVQDKFKNLQIAEGSKIYSAD